MAAAPSPPLPSSKQPLRCLGDSSRRFRSGRSAAELERLLWVVRHRVLRLLEKRGALLAQGPEDALQAYKAHSLQQRLRWTEVDVRLPPRKQPRCAFLEVFSLHANTDFHENNRQGLERLCRYGARGALALECLSRVQDGRLAYRMKRPLADGTTHLFFTGLELLRHLASLVPPPRANLTRFMASSLRAPSSAHFCSLQRGRRRAHRRRASPWPRR
ncbi:transposase [Pyxidicoccus sp. MSG2]|uniref:transposase n=1 Tax=Pyxidicoccus sp. MSG2 TaxID=2996790 RepID=UPI0022721B39|nr:transposase [Pyxidicoccus sp. MSG2]MCY1019155.1 transposase [Pyxidicoccus sp. MSG2]